MVKPGSFLIDAFSGGTKNFDWRRKLSSFPVSILDRWRSGPIIPAFLKVCNDPRSDAAVRTAGFDCWNPWAPGIGVNFGPIWNLVSTVCPHQPAYLFSSSVYQTEQTGGVTSVAAHFGISVPFHFSWINNPAIPPGPEFRYLYVHHTAKSTSHSCNESGTLPTAWARSHPQMHPW